MAPLDGIRIIDFTTAMAGPSTSMLLADFGADVIKIEPPGGESSRTWGTARFGADGGFSGLFLALNRNKSSLVIDLKDDEDRARAHELMREADVVMESFKPGGAERLGIGYEQARELRADVVYLSISGFGQTGPMRTRPGYDQLLQAYAGHMSVTGEPDRPSVRIGPSAIDLLTGAHAAYGVLLALRERDRTGEGQHVETSLYDSSIQLVTHFIADYTGSGRVPEKVGGDFAFLAPYGMFQGRDREFYMGVGSERMFAALCASIGRPDLLEDPRFARNGERIAHREELNAELAPVFARRDAAELVELCTELGIPASLVSTIAEVVEQDQAHARDMIVDSGIDGVRTAGVPIKLSRSPGTVRRPPPRLDDANA
jgi:crotonobetainyl-CoA:carnitine CoA-transferase CaiB-like acyl-CoA transferase